MDRNETIKQIREALKRRSGIAWSVKGGRGTSYGWIRIDAPPARRTWGCRLRDGATSTWPEDYEVVNLGIPDRMMSPADQELLGELLGLGEKVHCQGESIPGGSDYYQEYIDRAEGRTPSRIGTPYWY